MFGEKCLEPHVPSPHVCATVQMLWQEKACHLLGTDEDKIWLFISGIWPEAGDESEDSLSLCHSQVVWDQWCFPGARCSCTPLTAHLILIFLFFFPPKLNIWLWVMGLREPTWTKKPAGTDPNTQWIISGDTHQGFYDHKWHNNSVQLKCRFPGCSDAEKYPSLPLNYPV